MKRTRASTVVTIGPNTVTKNDTAGAISSETRSG